MESKNRFPQSLENAHAFSHIPTARPRLCSLKKKGIIVDREREKYLTLISVETSRQTEWLRARNRPFRIFRLSHGIGESTI